VATAAFDPAAYKETTRAQWQDAAHAWHSWDPLFDRWLGPATELMLDLAGVGEGTRVIDIAAGSGGQSIAAGRRGATVLATDISSNILEEAAAAARAAGVSTIATRVVDGEALDVAPGSFDAAISRLGLMYMPDKQGALAQARRALRDGGKYAAIVFAEPELNRFFSVPIGIVRRRAELPPPAPGLPGPFSSVTIADQLDAAGFRDVEVRRVDAPLQMATAAECARMERESFGALHQMLAGLAATEQEDAWREIAEALEEFNGPDGFSGPCELLVGAGTK
jgi:ubiquinone/menaquinone biosynthesis C-methylase UbiE